MEKYQNNNTNKRIKLQRVKNYSADEIGENEIKQKESNNQHAVNMGKAEKTKGQSSKSVHHKKTTVWTKVLVGITYFFGLTSLLYFLSSAWIFLGTISLAFSLTIFLLAKHPTTKESSGKVFFVSLCGTIISMLFWVLYLTTRRYGIGFLSSLFRAIQIASAVVSALLILYYFVEFVSGGKFKINWLNNITEKAEQKFSHKEAKS